MTTTAQTSTTGLPGGPHRYQGRRYTKAMTPAQFRREAERMIRTGNPDAVAVGIVFEWLRVGPLVDCKGGPGKFRTGEVRVISPGHQTKVMHASLFAHGGGSVR